MLQDTKHLYGLSLAATDGDIGHVKDFYFDDRSWVVRYLVIDTGTWLTSRRVLLPPHALTAAAENAGRTLRVDLTRERIERCPPIDTHLPVSRQYEIDYFRHYGWPAYWEQDAPGRFRDGPALEPEMTGTTPAASPPPGKDRHLCSTRAVTGYQVQARDGALGRVSGFLVDERDWTIPQVRAETGQWYSGKEIRIATSHIESIDYEGSSMLVGLTRAAIEQASEAERALRRVAV